MILYGAFLSVLKLGAPLSMNGKEQLEHSSKHLYVPPKKESHMLFFPARVWISDDRSFAWTIPLSRMLLIHRQTPTPKYNILCVSCKSSNPETCFPDPHMFFSLVHKQITSDNEGTWHDMKARFYQRFDSVSLKERSSLAILVWDQDNLHLIWLSQLRGFDSLEAIDWELNPYSTKKPEICRVYYCTMWNWIRSQWFLPKPKSRTLVFLSHRTPWKLIPVVRTTPRVQWRAMSRLKLKLYWTT